MAHTTVNASRRVAATSGHPSERRALPPSADTATTSMQIPPVRPAQFHLAEHVRACRIDEQVVLLDLKRGRYLGVTAKSLAGLDLQIDGLRIDHAADRDAPASRVAFRDSLLARGLITPAPPRPMATPGVEEALQTLGASESMSQVIVSTANTRRFVLGAANAAVALRCRSLFQIARSVAARRMRCAGSAHSDTNTALTHAVATFEQLRPLLFTSRDRCLFDSLCLVNFLAAHAMFPTWVVGVATRPFSAHSWVQSGTTVLNDLHEHVRAYRPILVV